MSPRISTYALTMDSSLPCISHITSFRHNNMIAWKGRPRCLHMKTKRALNSLFYLFKYPLKVSRRHTYANHSRLVDISDIKGAKQWRIHSLAESAMAPLWPKLFVEIVKKIGKLSLTPLCVSPRGQRTVALLPSF